MTAPRPQAPVLHRRVVESPVGPLVVVGGDPGLRAVLWGATDVGRVRLPATLADDPHPVVEATATQLAEYFAGRRRRFDVPLDLVGTPFQLRVWQVLSGIAFGTTSSYRDVAVAVDSPAAVRAVGAAIGRNPVSIVVPCHRVLGADGRLTGFAGGLDAKRTLLELEASAVTDQE